ncbi:MAG: polysaccharide deacetylase family protein [Gammaproteobacteria bacterium]|nr:polysaccharide deacetylase family protein [Gammaproteobacteria bacterium]
MSFYTNISNRMCKLYGLTATRFFPHKVILCYHNVHDPKKSARGWLSKARSVDVDMFSMQMKWLKEVGEVVSLNTICSDSKPSKSCEFSITFDDGYFNNIDTAIPVLQKYEIPMTWFVCTGFVDDPDSLPWWDLIDLAIEQSDSALDLARVLPERTAFSSVSEQSVWMNSSLRNILKSSNRDQRDAIVEAFKSALSERIALPANAFSRPHELQEISNLDLIEIGGHTVTHPNVALCSEPELRSEIKKGKQRLEELLGKPVRWFAYPFGGKGSFNTAAKKSVIDFGFKGAVTLQPGIANRLTDQFEIPRIPISPGMSLEAFKSRVLGAPLYSLLYRMRSGAAGYG